MSTFSYPNEVVSKKKNDPKRGRRVFVVEGSEGVFPGKMNMSVGSGPPGRFGTHTVARSTHDWPDKHVHDFP